MKFTPAALDGAWLIEPRVFEDDRGAFFETYSLPVFAKNGINAVFVQDNHSFSATPGILRGLHYQSPPLAQCKLVRVVAGAIYDVIVDIRRDSPTFGKWEGFALSADNRRILFVPQGFAHGFCTTSANAEVIYKVDNVYSRDHDNGIRWNDPTFNIPWPVDTPTLSPKDAALPFWKDMASPF
jgi:dTDP-4-dehydrorhamnose 3,5-epimerase